MFLITNFDLLVFDDESDIGPGLGAKQVGQLGHHVFCEAHVVGLENELVGGGVFKLSSTASARIRITVKRIVLRMCTNICLMKIFESRLAVSV